MIKTRVASYPAAAAKAMHQAHAVVPLRVASILRHEPQLVAPAVEAFHYRDLDDMKVCCALGIWAWRNVIGPAFCC